VWRALGRVNNYVEPFFGSGAVLLARPVETWATPDAPGTETVNDKSRFLANFWRAVSHAPDEVAAGCDWPVNEADLHARHKWLVKRLPELAALLDGEPEAFDAKVAAWWCWGACAWIGSGWCDETRGDEARTAAQVRHLSGGGMGVHRKLPHLGGNHDSGRGVHSRGRSGVLFDYFAALSARLRRVRVACGDWSRVTGDSVTWRHGVTGVFLDPPYLDGEVQYAAGGAGTSLSADARAWAVEAGKRRDMRVVLAGYEGEHDMPSDWRVIAWKARGGYGSQRKDGTVNENARRERLYLSPHCVEQPPRQPSLFDLGGGAK
jgi:DNA adenine methylase